MQVPEEPDGGGGERPAAVDERGRGRVGRVQEDRAQRHAGGIGEDGGVVADAVGDAEQLTRMGGEPFGVRAGRSGAVAEVQRGRDCAAIEVAARRVAALGARGARRVDAAGNARQPRVQHDAFAGVGAAGDGFVPQDVRERQERRERVVEPPVQEDLLGVGAADAGDGGIAEHPVRGRGDRLGDVLEARRRGRGDERTVPQCTAHFRDRLTGKVVPEHERLHVAPLTLRDRSVGGVTVVDHFDIDWPLLRNELDCRVVVGDAGAVPVAAGQEHVAFGVEHLDVAGAEWGAVHECAQLAVARPHHHRCALGEAEAVGVDIRDEDAVAGRTRQGIDLGVHHRVELLPAAGAEPQPVCPSSVTPGAQA